MIRRLLFISFFVICALGNSQIVEIPDPVFKFGLVNYSVADLDGNGSFESDVDTNDDGEIQVSEAEAVIGLEVPAYTVGGIHIQSLEGIEAFINLEFLNCSQQEITSLNLTTLSQLKELHCHTNLLTSIDVTQNTNLEYFTCLGNPIEGGIETYNNPNLRFFQCGSQFPDSQINFLDVTQNPLLEVFACTVADMATIDVSQNPLLENFSFRGTSIVSIDITQNTNLKYFGFGNTSIEHLDISKNKLLRSLYCDNNLLKNLDVSSNINLLTLFCRFNKLKFLDVSSNPLLTRVNCEGNELIYLNVNNGNNYNFESMNAPNNPDLTCIQVDDVDYANAQDCINYLQGWCKDETAIYSSFCELGLNDFDDESVIIYPNPVNDFLFIQCEKPIKKIKVYNLLGQEMLNINQDFDMISLHQIPKGVFLLKIFSIDRTTTKIIIKE